MILNVQSVCATHANVAHAITDDRVFHVVDYLENIDAATHNDSMHFVVVN